MAYLTNYQYYANGGVAPLDANLGSYQHLSINDVIVNFIQFYTGDDKYLDNVKRNEVRHHAKQVVKKLNYDAFKAIKIIEIEVDSSGRAAMPHDYVDYVRISYEKDGVLYPMRENSTTTTAKAYLKDIAGDLVFDGSGNVEYDTSALEDARLTPSTPVTVNGCEYQCYNIGPKYGLDSSKMNINPQFNINNAMGTIEFNSTMIGELIVVEYISDGMEGGDDDQIVIHKFFEDYVYSYIEYHMLLRRPSTPVTIRDEMKKKARALYRNAKIRAMKTAPEELLMALRGGENWFK